MELPELRQAENKSAKLTGVNARRQTPRQADWSRCQIQVLTLADSYMLEFIGKKENWDFLWSLI